jgi:uncharacterized protein (DUF58 family)
LDVHESLPVQLATPPFYRYAASLRGHGQRRLAYELHCEERGYYEIGPLVVRTGDLLGVTRPRSAQLAAEPLIVYPKVLPLQALGLPTYSPQVALPARSPLFLDPSRVMGVRDYQRGDSPRRVHWTATAKASAGTSMTGASMTRLMVKQYQAAISRETLICLDLYRENYSRRHWSIATERAIVVAASLANHIVVREGLAVGLVTEARDPRLPEEPGTGAVRFSLPPRTGQGQLMRLLEVLACAQVASRPAAEAGFATLLRETSKDLPWGTTLVIVTGKESSELLDTVFYLQRAGFAVSLILVRPGRVPVHGPVADGDAESVGRLGVPVYRVWEEGDLGSAFGQASPTLGRPRMPGPGLSKGAGAV